MYHCEDVFTLCLFGVLWVHVWCPRTPLMAWMAKNLPAMQETGVGKNLWRREWQPAPVFLPGESHGQRILAGHSPWGHKELDMTIWLAHIWVNELQYPNLSSVWEVLSHYFFIFFSSSPSFSYGNSETHKLVHLMIFNRL